MEANSARVSSDFLVSGGEGVGTIFDSGSVIVQIKPRLSSRGVH